MDARELGNRIRARRQALGLTQGELADAVGVHVSSVISWEKGEHFPRRKLGAIEKVLGPLSNRPEPEGNGGEKRTADALANEVERMGAQMRRLADELRKERRSGTENSRRAG